MNRTHNDNPTYAIMRIKPKFDNVSVVLLGSFNPGIFQPAWFAQHGMIGDKEAENPGDMLQLKDQVVTFRVGMFGLNVQPDRFDITSLDDPHEHIKDLVVSCFGEYLPHTPVSALGINRNVHFEVGNFEIRDYVGSRLAPKDAWGEWGKEIEKAHDETIDKRGGMLSITMLQNNLQLDGYKGSVQAKVEPSNRIEGNAGIFIHVNNHFELTDEEKPVQGASSAVEALEAHWETSMNRARMIVDQIMALTEEYEQ